MKKNFSSLLTASLVAAAMAFSSSATAQLSLSTEGAPVAINFDGFLGDGFDSPPGAGQLDSAIWRITGMSDGDGTFGGTHGSDDPRNDFSRGFSTGGVTSGGIYAFDTGSVTILGVQPTGADFTPGEITLRATNNTGEQLDEFIVTYDIWYLNDQGRANSLNFAFSTNDTVYGPIASADFTTPEAADGSPTWQMVSRSATVSTVVADGGTIYFQWQSDDVSGGGSRDELGIANISVTGNNTGSAPDADLVSAYSISGDVVRASLNFEPPSIDPADFTLTDSQSAATITGITQVDGSIYDLQLSAALTDTVEDTLTYNPSSTSASFIGGITDLINYRNGTITADNLITVNVVVTAIGGSNVAAQAVTGDPAGRGILFFSSGFASSVDVGDEIVVAGTTFPFTDGGGSVRNQLASPILISSQPGTLPTPAVVPASDFHVGLTTGNATADQWEGVLITINNLTFNGGATTFGERLFDAGADTVMSNNTFYPGGTDDAPNFITGNVYNLTGIGWDSFGNYKIDVRSDDDVDGILSVSDWLLH